MLQDLLNLVVMNLPAAILLLVGLGLLIVEMFTPGFGVAGGAGLVCLIISVVLKAQTVLEGILMGLVLLVITGAAFTVSLRSIYKGRLSKTPLVLEDSMSTASGFVPSDDLSGYVGREGVAVTVLRPAGTAEFGGVKLDVVSDGAFIMPSTRVKVMEVNGPRVVVQKAG